MRVTRSIEETRQALEAARAQGRTIGLVPTMGALHEGHLSLVGLARQSGADFIVVSIFVNPRQFGRGEDLSRYPRDEQRDRSLLERAGVDLLFMPTVEEMYPAGSTTTVSVRGVAEPLEGERRPGHFDGVTTVVSKLFHIVQPELAAFGRKDAQQCAVIARMVKDLDMPVRLVFGATVREPDGLALSSRNVYLRADERQRALALHRALRAGEEALQHGVEDVTAVEQLMHKMANETPGLEIDYLVVVDPETLTAPANFRRDLLLAGAMRVGSTRLIDNILVPAASIPHTKL